MTRSTQIVIRCSPEDRDDYRARAAAWATEHRPDLAPGRALSEWIRWQIAPTAPGNTRVIVPGEPAEGEDYTYEYDADGEYE